MTWWSVSSLGQGADRQFSCRRLANYIHPCNLDLALTTINLLRFPFNTTTPPGNDHNNLRYRRTLTLTESWNIAGYLTEVLSNGKRLHEFLELADQVNQLASIFASVNHAEYYWFKMYYLYTTASTEDVVLFLVNMIRRRMLQAINRNPPGKQPTDLDGNPIEPNFFARAQQAFWLHELKLRAWILEEGWNTKQIQIPGDENPADIVETLQGPHDIDVRRFLELVELQRFEGTFFDHGIEDPKKLRVLNERLLGCSTPEHLGFRDQPYVFLVVTIGTACSCFSSLRPWMSNRGFSGKGTIFNLRFGMMVGLRSILSLGRSSTSHLASIIPASREGKTVKRIENL
ncbi:hypothetical protein FDENT_13077 [Fusarium denticulatum]|uniref:Uncharacterized protein n=1 Tax=Fusarium denticulatum TaxID=48507 RepID=A0A8H5WM63_9HYPO|nr:hypothetical protein FDENT_13077 [Fusarium denticulatum]